MIMEFAEVFFRLKVAREALEELEGQNQQSEPDELPEEEPIRVPFLQRLMDALGFSPEWTSVEDRRDLHSNLR
jgi:hypothetical protein